MKAWCKAVSVFSCGLLALSAAARADDQRPGPAAQRTASSTLTFQPSPSESWKEFRSPWLREVLKLSDARVADDVLLAFIDTAGTFSLTSEQVIQLSDQGFPPELVKAMLLHDVDISTGVRIAPEPPPMRMIPALPPMRISKASPAVEEPRGKQTDESIVNPSPAEDRWDFLCPAPELSLAMDIPRAPHTIVSRSDSPVRQPQAQQLTSPIRIYRSAVRFPNHISVVSFP